MIGRTSGGMGACRRIRMTDFTLTRQEMILLHLLQYIDVTLNGHTMPFAQTQDGIGMAMRMSRSYVATVVGILEDKGLVAWVSTHPKGSRVRIRVYYLLPPEDPEGEGNQRQAGGKRGSHRRRHRASGEHR